MGIYDFFVKEGLNVHYHIFICFSFYILFVINIFYNHFMTTIYWKVVDFQYFQTYELIIITKDIFSNFKERAVNGTSKVIYLFLIEYLCPSSISYRKLTLAFITHTHTQLNPHPRSNQSIRCQITSFIAYKAPLRTSDWFLNAFRLNLNNVFILLVIQFVCGGCTNRNT